IVRLRDQVLRPLRTGPRDWSRRSHETPTSLRSANRSIEIRKSRTGLLSLACRTYACRPSTGVGPRNSRYSERAMAPWDRQEPLGEIFSVLAVHRACTSL